MNLSLFDFAPMQKGAGETTGRPVDAGDAHHPVRASSDHAVDAPPQECSGSVTDGVRRAGGSEIPPDVLRIVQHKAGPFRQLRDGQLTGREYRFVELHEHSLWIEFTDNGERIPAPALAGMWLDDGVSSGMFVEVRS